MMVLVKTYTAPIVDVRETLRYAGVRKASHDMVLLVEDCQKAAAEVLDFRVCYAEFPMTIGYDSTVDFGFARMRSIALAEHLQGCDRAVVFAATVGLGLDRLIAKAAPKTPSRALLLDAVGVERIEALCEAFCADLAAQGKERGDRVTRRFSPGYGDLSLIHQRNIARVLDTARHIGVSLNESCLMSPSKSVTAIVGLIKK